jgi:hypothetical protein
MSEVGEGLPRLRDLAEVKADPEFVEDFVDAPVAPVDVDLSGRAVRFVAG